MHPFNCERLHPASFILLVLIVTYYVLRKKVLTIRRLLGPVSGVHLPDLVGEYDGVR